MKKYGILSIIGGILLTCFDIFIVPAQYFGQISVSGGILIGMGVFFLFFYDPSID